MTPDQWLAFGVCGGMFLAFVCFVVFLRNEASSGKLKPKPGTPIPGHNVPIYGARTCGDDGEQRIITHERDRLFGSRGEMYRTLSKHAIDSLKEDTLIGAGPVENTVIEGYYTEGK
jgi:hypothetical protein